MKIIVLVENNTLMDNFYKGEPGLSILIEDEEKKILLDTGYSGVFLDNALWMGYDLLDLDYIVLSHSHFDHTWGLNRLISYYVNKKAAGIKLTIPEIITHPSTFNKRTIKKFDDISPILTEQKLRSYFSVTLTKKEYFITDDLVYLGYIERNNSFEAQNPIGKVIVDGKEVDDYVKEDSALAYNTKDGLIIITGCSHAGICNIVERAKSIFNQSKVLDIIGGFHLMNPDNKQLEMTIDYLKRLKPIHIHPCHCTDFQSRAEINKIINIPEIGVGYTLTF
ncbi:MAG: MBL fold metallo-hydrolase [Halanaerobiales bacterium]|nr:MBL fold metallo-hydrolase [Halanaerobiales bacterium]